MGGARAKRRTGQCWQDYVTLPTEGLSPLPYLAATLALTLPYKIGEVVTTIPTIGFNVESVSYKNLNFNVWVRTPLHSPPLSLGS